MNAPAFHHAPRRGLHTLFLALTFLSAWFGLMPDAISAPSLGTPLTHPSYRIERPAAPTETCLSRSSQLPSHLTSRGETERAASEPPRIIPVLPVWLDELPRHRPVAILRALSIPDDQSLIVPPRQPRGPPASPRA